jgi:arsenite methyltransferase
MIGLEFTNSTARRLEALYLTADVVAQRSETLKNLRLAEGEFVIDIGCGPGFLCESMAEIVGRTGRVVGLDISHDLVRMAERRNNRKWLSYRLHPSRRVHTRG